MFRRRACLDKLEGLTGFRAQDDIAEIIDRVIAYHGKEKIL